VSLVVVGGVLVVVAHSRDLAGRRTYSSESILCLVGAVRERQSGGGGADDHGRDHSKQLQRRSSSSSAPEFEPSHESRVSNKTGPAAEPVGRGVLAASLCSDCAPRDVPHGMLAARLFHDEEFHQQRPLCDKLVVVSWRRSRIANRLLGRGEWAACSDGPADDTAPARLGSLKTRMLRPSRSSESSCEPCSATD
jgi:hypothetical protein